ncbi:MAG: Gfo/Idh/MocA family oxidoreductase [Sphaerochaetaceae bacterium]
MERNDSMKKFGVAIIGCGAVAKNHGKAVNASKQADLLYCIDLDAKKAQEFCAVYGGTPLVDYHEILDDPSVDIVHIVTPHFTHADIAIDCMLHGKQVFCEKPLAINVSDGQRMIAVSRKTGCYLGICFQNRMNDASVAAKDLIDREVYGQVLSVVATVRWDRHGEYYSKSPWRGQYDTEGGGCIINQSIHTIDLMQYLCGKVTELTAIDAHMRETHDYEVDDSCMANFVFANGATGVGYFTNCAKLCKTADVEIICEKGALLVSQKGLTITTTEGSSFIPSEVATGEKSEWGLSHGRLIEAFYTAVATNKPFLVDGTAALEAVKIIQALQYSKGKTVKVK